MSEALLGVVLGGLIASVTPLCTLYFEIKRWKHDKRIEYLRAKRAKAEEDYSKAIDSLSKAMREDNYPPELVTNLLHFFPKSVTDAFGRLVDDGVKTEEAKELHQYYIQVEMQKDLAAMDQKIEEELGLQSNLPLRNFE